MQDTELFLALAEIAGVFVGFGALIAVRSGGAMEAGEVGYIRVVVWMGMMAAIAALAPVTISRYDLAEHQIWAFSSTFILIGYVVFLVVNLRTPEYRANWAESLAGARSGLSAAVDWAAYVVYVVVLTLAPLVIVLGLATSLEPALYFTLVVLILLGAAWILLALVYAQRSDARRPTRSGPSPSGPGRASDQ